MFIVPRLQVWAFVFVPHTVNDGAGGAGEESLANAAICTVTSSALPLFGLTVMLYSAPCPECTEEAWAVTVTHRSVGVAFGVEDAWTADAFGPAVAVWVGLGPGELGPEGSTWHPLPADAAIAACDPAKAAAVAPVHTMATPANTANTEDPVRLPRVRLPGRDPSWGVVSRFSIIG